MGTAQGREQRTKKKGAAQPCRLYVVRHGTTTMNVQNRYRGRRDIPLDAQGYQDAVDAARRLSTEGLTAVYTGPLRRTIATAQIIADEARVPDIRILHGLVNLDYGDWEGMTADLRDTEARYLHVSRGPRRASADRRDGDLPKRLVGIARVRESGRRARADARQRRGDVRRLADLIGEQTRHGGGGRRWDAVRSPGSWSIPKAPSRWSIPPPAAFPTPPHAPGSRARLPGSAAPLRRSFSQTCVDAGQV